MGWFKNPFKRKPRYNNDRRGLAGTFRAGDLAECVVPSYMWADRRRPNPLKGEILRVSAVREAVGNLGDLCRGLSFVGRDPTHVWDATAFRKIVHTHDPAEEGWFDEIMKKIGAM